MTDKNKILASQKKYRDKIKAKKEVQRLLDVKIAKADVKVQNLAHTSTWWGKP